MSITNLQACRGKCSFETALRESQAYEIDFCIGHRTGAIGIYTDGAQPRQIPYQLQVLRFYHQPAPRPIILGDQISQRFQERLLNQILSK